MRKLACALAVAALAVGGCGGDGEDDGAPADPASPVLTNIATETTGTGPGETEPQDGDG